MKASLDRFCRGAVAIVWLGTAALVLCPLAAMRAAAADDVTTPAPEPAESRRQALKIENVTIHVDLTDTQLQGGTSPIMKWIERSAHIVAGYYGRFPVSDLRIRVMVVNGRGVRGGTTFGDPRALIRVTVGRAVTEAQLLNDWILVHEMTHLALPEMGRTHLWLAEGLATYVEGIARVQAGNRTPEAVWVELVQSMPQGLPAAGDQGLDRTHTWGRTYWGGALFCLMADVRIRSRTQNKLGLQDAMRAVATQSGGIIVEWPIDKVLATADAAVGGNVLTELYAEMKDAPVAPDLAALWNQLGVNSGEDTIELRGDAPQAAIRDAIMTPRRR